MIWFALVGVLMIVLAVPMIRNRVPPNNWYGFRVKRTLEDQDVWYKANAYAGKLLLILGIVILVTAGLVSLLFPGLNQETTAIIMVSVILGGILLVLVASLQYVKMQ